MSCIWVIPEYYTSNSKITWKPSSKVVTVTDTKNPLKIVWIEEYKYQCYESENEEGVMVQRDEGIAYWIDLEIYLGDKLIAAIPIAYASVGRSFEREQWYDELPEANANATYLRIDGEEYDLLEVARSACYSAEEKLAEMYCTEEYTGGSEGVDYVTELEACIENKCVVCESKEQDGKWIATCRLIEK